jgi:hypothetical protein
VELVNGRVVRREKPSRAYQAAATRITTPEQEASPIDVPIRIQINWNRLAHLVRQ